jgi:hypothetical protein
MNSEAQLSAHRAPTTSRNMSHRGSQQTIAPSHSSDSLSDVGSNLAEGIAPMHPINRLSWVPSAAYLYTLWLDRVLLAWEYLRRNPDYRREFRCETALRQQRSPACWGLKLWEDPDQDSRAVDPLWQIPADTEVLLAPKHTGGEAPRFDLWKIPGSKSLRADGGQLCLTTRAGSAVVHRVRWATDLAQGDRMEVSFIAGRQIRARNRAAQGFLRSFDSVAPQAVSSSRPSLTSLTHMRILQALDGAAAGASHRELACAVFGAFTAENWDSDSVWRRRVRYLLQCGRARCTHGYRRMLGLDEALKSPRSATPHARAQTNPRQMGLCAAQPSNS